MPTAARGHDRRRLRKAVAMFDATAVLLIDADSHYLDYYSQRLESSATNYAVVKASTGQSGLDICARQPIECVVLEIDLPDMSGFEVLARLVPRVYHPDIAVIVLTRLPNAFLLDLAIRNGALAAFQKIAGSAQLLEESIPKAISRVQVLTRLVS
jgi:PleD family two-component response regulator